MKEPSILIVDDDSDVLELADYFFKEKGMEVHCVESGSRALEEIHEKSFAVMLTDFNMPGMNGLELAEKVREIAPQIRIIMATGHPSQELFDLAVKAGIVTVLAKPLHLEGLLDLVTELAPPTSS
jgi:two-component system C4-dicarboxylate transport response regulator DctD